MNDETRPVPTDPIAPIDTSLGGPAPTSGWAAAGVQSTIPVQPAAPAAAFSGRTPRKSDAIRAGMVVGTGLVVALGAAVAMGASPTPSSANGSQPQVQAQPSAGTGGPAAGAPGFGFGPGGQGKPFGGGGPGRGDHVGFGAITVTAISGSNVSLATADGWTRAIAVTATTTVTKGGAAAALSDLAVGDEIRFQETRNSDGTYAITALAIVQPQTAGTVTAVGSDSITITLRDGTSQTVTTTASTTYHLEQADGSRTDVTVGSTIVASGEKATDGTLTASSVWVRLPHVMGTVKTVGTDSVTLTQPDGTTITVHVSASTTIRVAGVDGAKLADLKVGMTIVVEGAKRADGSIDATELGAGDHGFGRGRGGDHGALGLPGAPAASPVPDASSGTNG